MNTNTVTVNYRCEECNKITASVDFEEQDLPKEYKDYPEYIKDGYRNIDVFDTSICDECTAEHYEAFVEYVQNAR